MYVSVCSVSESLREREIECCVCHVYVSVCSVSESLGRVRDCMCECVVFPLTLFLSLHPSYSFICLVCLPQHVSWQHGSPPISLDKFTPTSSFSSIFLVWCVSVHFVSSQLCTWWFPSLSLFDSSSLFFFFLLQFIPFLLLLSPSFSFTFISILSLIIIDSDLY